MTPRHSPSRLLTRLSLAALFATAIVAGCSGPASPDGSTDAVADRAGDVASDVSNVALGDVAMDTTSDGVAACARDADCDDGVYCNGAERCMPGAAGADARGCAAAATPSPCMSTQTCNEAMRRCVSACDTNPDADGDGHNAQSCGGDDCDDADAMRFPGNPEVCDGSHDEDCNPATVGGTDNDIDGYISSACCNARTGMPAVCGDDCNDTAASVHPTAPEVCNGIDDNCNGMADDSLPVFTYFADCDGDNFGAMGSTGTDACGPPVTTPMCGGVAPMAQWVRNSSDCDDRSTAVNPGTGEICDGLDNNCNGGVDDTLPMLTFYADCDGDNFGSATATPVMNCGTPAAPPSTCPAPSPLARWSMSNTDCDDTQASVNTGATEVCNGIDDNCNGLLDGPAEDADGDGHPNNNCAGALGTDCDDSDGTIYNGATELCDGIDSNCSVAGHAHPAGMSPVNAAESSEDADGDHHTSPAAACTGGAYPKDDCDDSITPGFGASRYPGNTEVCDAIDNDCNLVVDDSGTGVAGSVCYPTVLGFGSQHGCALREGSAFCWGTNTNGTLGNGLATTQRGAVRAGTFTNLVAIDGGQNFTCAVNSAGSVYCWGTGMQGQLGNGITANQASPVLVTGLTNAAPSINLGYAHACVIRGTGTVNCWGDGSQGQLGRGTTATVNPPAATDVAGITDALQIASGQFHTCVLHRSGRVSCWGWNVTGMLGDGSTTQSLVPVSVTGLTDAVEIASNNFASCARRSTGQVVCWGGNANGQLGDGTIMTRTTPVNVTGLPDAAQISGDAMGSHFCARRTSGAIVCWGRNSSGELGDGTTTDRPILVSAGITGGTTRVTVGSNFSCVQLTSGQMQCWGNNSARQLGDGTTTQRTVPSNTAVFSRVLAITTGGGDISMSTGGHACARTTSGSVVCWGSNVNGQLGDGTTTTSTVPVPASGLADVVQVSAGGHHTCAIVSSGQVYCWGYNGKGQLGDGTYTEHHAPAAVPGITDAIHVAAGHQHTCVVHRSGTLSCWGQQAEGQLGDGVSGARLSSTVPVDVIGITDGVQVAVSGVHSCVRRAAGTISCWGGNTNGQLGDGTTNQATTPVSVAGVTGAIDLDAGPTHTCAATSMGRVYCWGSNANGQLGIAVTTAQSPNAVVAGTIADALGVSVGASHSCASRTSGVATCWGAGTNGQLGNSATADSATPVNATELSDVIEMSAAQGFTCARTRARGVACWGQNDQSQIGTGATNPQTSPLMFLGLP